MPAYLSILDYNRVTYIYIRGTLFFQNCLKNFVLTPETLNLYIKWKILEYEALKMFF